MAKTRTPVQRKNISNGIRKAWARKKNGSRTDAMLGYLDGKLVVIQTSGPTPTFKITPIE